MRLIGKIVRNLVIVFFASTLFAVIVYRFVPVMVTPLMVIRSVDQLVHGEKVLWHHEWVSQKKLSKNIQRAVIASEDQRFYDHWGFDTRQIQKAVRENQYRDRPRGASTISQQTAKNVFLWPQSSWYRKGLEVYFTVLIEVCWSKDRILEVYLNSMETGDGIYGAQSVAKLHFGTTAAKLTKRQAALIAATLPNPRRFNSAYPSAYIRQRQSQIVRQMRFIALPSDR
jgi:monofunctional biosynthetic peptidoglycan transglycosylase